MKEIDKKTFSENGIFLSKYETKNKIFKKM